MINLKSTLFVATAFAVSTTLAGAAVIITENFDSSSGSTPPTGWSFVDSTNGGGAYSTVTGNPGNAGAVSNGSNGNPPTAYIVNNGTAFDLTQTVTVSFDVQMNFTGSYDSGAVFFGDIADGVTGAAGQLLTMNFGSNNFGNDDPEIRDGAGTSYTPGENQQKVYSGTWHSATYTWTPNSGTTGNLTFVMTGTKNGDINMTTNTPFTFDSNEGYFAFGDLDAANPVVFDNIEITGTQIAVPEPASIATGLFGLTLIAGRRRRRA
jgi:MYXO-CTERM domain-containing protein